MVQFDGSTMADTWVWQSVADIELDPPGDHVFQARQAGDHTRVPHSVTVWSTGHDVTGPLTIALSGPDAGSFTLSADSIANILVGGHYAFTVVPNTNLSAREHTATVTVSGVNVAPRSFTVSFTVTPTPPSNGGGSCCSGEGPPIGGPPGDYDIHRAFMFGDGRGDFRPGGNLTRAEAAAILARTQLLAFERGIRSLPPGMATFDVFTDVSPGQWFYHYVAWAYDAGLVRGFAGTFRPNDPVTREELSAMIVRSGTRLRPAGTTTFHDIENASGWARAYVYTVYRESLMIGDQRGNFRPRENITRAETATAMNRLLGRIDSWSALREIDLRNPDAIRDFPDVGESGWYVPSVIAAANDHRLGRGGAGGAGWKEILA